MKFTLDAQGAQAAAHGIGSLLKAFALGPSVREQAGQDMAGKMAQIYANNMQGDKYGAEAEAQRMTNTARMQPIDASLPAYLQMAQKIFQSTGDTNMERYANAGTDIQTQQIRDQALSNVGNLDMMNRLNTLARPGSTYTPYDNVGNTGYSINQATGAQVEVNPVVARLFQQVESALANQRNAAGALSNARRERVVSGLDKPVTLVDDETGQATVTAIPTQGDPRSIGVAAPKGTGADATNAKARNAVIAAVEKEMPGAPDAEIQAEVQRRLERRSMGGYKDMQKKMQLPKGYTPEQALSEAKAAIAAGKDKNAVIQRLREFGIEPKGL